MQFPKGIRGTASTGAGAPPESLLAFYWHFVRQAKGWFAAMFAACLALALLDTGVPLFIGRLVSLMAAADRKAALNAALPTLAGMLLLFLVGRPLVVMADIAIRQRIVIPGVTSLVRWQSHWHVIRQSWSFFQADFAGRIANRIMQTGQALRESVVSSIRSMVYVGGYGAAAWALMTSADWRLGMPTLLWFAGYVAVLRHYVPKMRELSRRSSDARSLVLARIVDSYSNILTVKLFARLADEDGFVREAVDGHQEAMGVHMRLIMRFQCWLTTLSVTLVVSTAVMGLWLWALGAVQPGMVAAALPLAWEIVSVSGFVAWEVSAIFENVGVVQEGMQSIAVPLSGVDRPGARALLVPRGEVRLEHVTFGYGRKDAPPVLAGLDLRVAPGERIGLVGRSGAGKSTLVNLLLRFYDLEGGSILIDGRDIAGVTQESLRAAIGMVTQDTSLLHRSIAANIRYGRPAATDAQVEAAAKKAQAHDFIVGLKDWKGNTGYAAHVGERGVKLSGGQRQRVALARVLLKDAPILVLDEATSSLDSEVEAAIQEQLLELMEGKTVIAIAHRLSTIARMDRLVVLERGRIVEMGTHAELLRLGGHYEKLWRHQSGGFLAAEPLEARAEPQLAEAARKAG